MEAPRSPLTGRDHPSTSHAAADSVRGLTATLREKVFLALQAAGGEGLTAEELETVCSLGGSTVRPRILEVQAEGRVIRTERTRPTRSGRKAYVYVALTREEEPTGRVCSHCGQPQPVAGGPKGGAQWVSEGHLHNGGRVYDAITPPLTLALEF